MQDYVLITDSTCDIEEYILQERNTPCIKLNYIIDGQDYFDGMTVEASKAFFALIRQGKMSKTSSINTERFMEFWQPYLEEGKDIVYLGFSSGLSATFNNACLAANLCMEEYPDRKIYPVDSLCAALGQGLLVRFAMDKRDEGATAEELVKYIEDIRLKINHWVLVDDLDHLKRGGRISGAAAMIGSIMNIKPVLHMNDMGKLIVKEKIKGHKKGINFLLEKLEKKGVDIDKNPVFISHADSLDDAVLLDKLIKERFPVKETYINYIGPVIGSHTGTGTAVIFFLGDDRG